MYEQARLGEDFRQAKIYVRKVTEDHSEKEINQILAEVRTTTRSNSHILGVFGSAPYIFHSKLLLNLYPCLYED